MNPLHPLQPSGHGKTNAQDGLIEKERSISRRGFLKAAGAAAAVAPIALPSIGKAGLPPSERIRMGMIGTGGRGRYEIPCIQHSRGADLVALCDIDSGALEQAKKILGGNPHVAFDYRRILDRPDIDGVVITTPPHLHKEMAVAALAARKHVYCEKPMAITPEDLDALVEASDKSSEVLLVGAERRYSKEIRKLVELIHGGAIGKVRFIHGWWMNKGDYPRSKPWLFDRSRSGDVVVEMVCHQIDVYNWIFESPPSRACAMGGINHYIDIPPGRSTTDHFGFVLEYPGALVTHCLTTYAGSFGGLRDQLQASEGSADFGLYDAKILRDGKWEELSWEGLEELPGAVRGFSRMRRAEWNAYQDFFDCIRTGKKPFMDARKARDFGLATLMVRRSYLENRYVTWEEMAGRKG